MNTDCILSATPVYTKNKKQIFRCDFCAIITDKTFQNVIQNIHPIPGTFCQAVVKRVLMSPNNVTGISLLIVIMKA